MNMMMHKGCCCGESHECMDCCEKHSTSKEHLEMKKKMLDEKLKWVNEKLKEEK